MNTENTESIENAESTIPQESTISQESFAPPPESSAPLSIAPKSVAEPE